MKKIRKLLFCNYTLLLLAAFMLATGIQLETASNTDSSLVWFHTAAGTIMAALIVYHIYLHFQWKAWPAKLRKQKSHITRILAVLFLLVALTGLISTVRFLLHPVHTHLGAIHGKIGFVFLLVCAIHTVLRRKLLKWKQSRRLHTKQSPKTALQSSRTIGLPDTSL